MGGQQSTKPTVPTARQKSVLDITFSCDEFTFDSLVLEGGGTKGGAYPGAIQVLEETGIWPRIKRLAGTSAGAMAAAFLAVGYNADELEVFLGENLANIFVDHSWGYASLLPNLVKYFGWNPETRFYMWLGEKFMAKTGNADITFMEVYEKYGRELCVVVTNVNQMKAEFCHPKTTPDMPIRIAVRMSTALPVYFQPVFYSRHQEQEIFVDGGVVCNYPIKCFDGWWLSMKPEDSFLRRMPRLSYINKVYDDDDRFGAYNPNTIGVLLYAGEEHEVFKRRLEARPGIIGIEGIPDTTLARNYKCTREGHDALAEEHTTLAFAVKKLTDILQERSVGLEHVVTAAEVEAIQGHGSLAAEETEAIFGKLKDPAEIIEDLTMTMGCEPTFALLCNKMEKRGLELQTRYQILNGLPKINRFRHFLRIINNTMLFNSQRQNVQERDFERTVGINTQHIGTIDFVLEDDDKEYIVQQGRRAMKAFICGRWEAMQAAKKAAQASSNDTVTS